MKRSLYLLLLTITFYACAHTDNYLIVSLTKSKNTILVTPHESFSRRFLKDSIVKFSYEESVNLEGVDDSVLSVPFLACAAPAVWVSGDRYRVASMDKDFYYALERIKAVLQIFYPQLGWKGALIPDKLVENKSTALESEEVGLLFSGGLDSVAASFGLLGKKQLLITNHGVDVPLKQVAMWENVQKSCKAFAQQYDHKNAFISFDYCALCKYDELINTHGVVSKWWWLDNVVDALQHCGATAPLLFVKGCKHLYIASSHTADFPYPYGSHPLIDNNLKFAGISVHHDQDYLTRMDKVNLVAAVTRKLHLPMPSLRVCWSDKEGKNCLSCEKCLRTCNNILSVGMLPEDFGFALSADEVMNRTRNFFQGTPIGDGRIVWEWRNIQRRLQQTVLMTGALTKDSNEERFLYFRWLASLPLEEFYSKKVLYPEDQRQQFEALWNLGSFLNTESARSAHVIHPKEYF